MKDSQVKEIFRSKLGMKVSHIMDNSHGVDHTVKIAKTDKGTYVLKKPGNNRIEISSAVFAFEKLKRLDVPIPKIVYRSSNYIIEDFADGKPLYDTRITNKEKEKILKSLGKCMRKIHSLCMRGYGPVVNGKGKYRTNQEYTTKRKKEIKTQMSFISKHKILKKAEIEQLKEYIDKNNELFAIKKTVLVHQDLHGDHVIIKNGKISGIIDWADVRSDDPMVDLTRMSYIFVEKPEIFESYVKGYGKIDRKQLDFQTVLLLLDQLPKAYKDKHEVKMRRRLIRIRNILREFEREEMKDSKYVYKKYSKKYRQYYYQENSRIKKALPNVRIEHVGSTAIPGLGGKGILDIAIKGTKAKADFIVRKLRHLGYKTSPDHPKDSRRIYLKRMINHGGRTREVHVHVCLTGEFWNSFLVFKDYLRKHSDVREQYAKIKREGAQRARGNKEKYRKYKKSFLDRIQRLALEEGLRR